jgi:hypothetical protein
MQELGRAISKVEKQSIDRYNELARHINRLGQHQAMEIQNKQIDVLKNILTHAYDKSSAYTNLIIIAGYVAYFSLWKEVKAFLPVKAMLISALLTAISALIFVLFEVSKMITGSFYFNRIGKELKNIANPQNLIEKFQNEQQQFTVKQFRIWVVALGFTLSTGLSGAGILVYYLFREFLNAF